MALEVTYEALMYSLRSGVGALSRADVRARLAELSENQVREACARVQGCKVHAQWTDEEARRLISTWKNCRA
jgi:hypothetical protein